MWLPSFSIPQPVIRLIGFIGLLALSGEVYAQGGPPGSCNPVSVDLRGQPAGVFDTSGLVRSNRCCSSNNCVQFDVQLDPRAIAFQVEITSGAVPGGSITYQIDCSGNPKFPGNTVCVKKKDSFSITFCKPGNNPNGYRITSERKPEITGDSVVYNGCTGLMVADSFTDSTIRWSSVSHNALYDSFLSCTAGCDSTFINLQKGYPDTVQYQVSGVPSYQCATDTVYDTLTVVLRDSLTAQIGITADAFTCSGPPDSATLTTRAKGGDPPYSYQWSTGQSTRTIRADTGQYSVVVNDAGYCQPAYDTFQLNSQAIRMPDPKIQGKDTICGIADTLTYHTTSDSTHTYQWQVSGPGSVVKGRAQDSALVRWDSAGRGHVTLTQTNKAGCDTLLSDTIVVSAYPSASIRGADTVCAFTDSHQYQTGQVSGHQYAWATTNGRIQTGPGTSGIEVRWRKAGTGSVSLTKTGIHGCQRTNQRIITIRPKPKPQIRLK